MPSNPPPPQYHFNPQDSLSHYNDTSSTYNLWLWPLWREAPTHDNYSLIDKTFPSHEPQNPSALKDYRQTSCHKVLQEYEKCVENNGGKLEACRSTWDNFDTCRDLSI
eukprot:GILI01001067.1.p1 GENE.GILI01001067.1~~GILI01001067.1.p1  ORF type:complete len:108 (+),score=12.53 GILI01001067.1:68-391(+)